MQSSQRLGSTPTFFFKSAFLNNRSLSTVCRATAPLFHSLENGEIWGVEISDFDEKTTPALLRALPNLWSLTLKNCNVTDEGIRRLFLTQAPLQNLTIENCDQIRGIDLQVSVHNFKVKNCRHLLTISDLKISEIWIENCKKFKRCERLNVEKFFVKDCPEFSGFANSRIAHFEGLNFNSFLQV